MTSSGFGEQRPQRVQRSAPAEQHLGDRLSAFVDGELTDDSRDRVLAHLATCPQCKTAADEQRRLKNVVAASELPAISAGLMARLQGLPGMGGDGPGDGDGPRGLPGDQDMPSASSHERRGPFDGGLLGSGVFGSGRRGGYPYLGPGRDLAAPPGSRSRGFRIHQPARAVAPVVPDPDARVAPSGSGTAAASRGRRFAFAAAGAFSLAAIAIGTALPMEAAVDGGARPDDGPAVSPLSADTSTAGDTRGVNPRGVLDARDAPRRHAPVLPASAPSDAARAADVSAASATSVPLTSHSSLVLH
ncbi:zf-HC2 domain-containing protein [Actinacidiphila rubida]|uniref:Putative zinc-finger n=1 Tax=Actinacidiphila rubida TaxID=310780 RepID=A0A1H8H913_9ACTN|nr:zf-HC2 domain-containing protein [Actinacidiphila rubida]SEN52722.1 Putative zinc-finger [Actinacidiphila rubida]